MYTYFGRLDSMVNLLPSFLKSYCMCTCVHQPPSCAQMCMTHWDIHLYTLPQNWLHVHAYTCMPAQTSNIDPQQRNTGCLMELNSLPTSTALYNVYTFSGSPKWSHMLCTCTHTVYIGSRSTTYIHVWDRHHYRERELWCKCKFCRICTTLLYRTKFGALAVLNIDVCLKIEVNC